MNEEAPAFVCPLLSGEVEMGRAFQRGDTVLLRQVGEMDLSIQLRFHEYLREVTKETGVFFVFIVGSVEIVEKAE